MILLQQEHLTCVWQLRVHTVVHDRDVSLKRMPKPFRGSLQTKPHPDSQSADENCVRRDSSSAVGSPQKCLLLQANILGQSVR